jgi:ATP-dependent Clp protease ATP-binding subunit ClpA
VRVRWPVYRKRAPVARPDTSEKGLTSRVFAQPNLSLDSIRKEIEGRITVREKVATSVEIPFSDESKRILQFAAEESDRLLHNYIGAEHLLLGILREARSLAGTILMEKGLRLDAVRQQLVTLLNERPSLAMDVAGSVADPPRRLTVQSRVFSSSSKSWEALCADASAFATAVGKQKLITISVAASGGTDAFGVGAKGVVIVWYWD